MPTVASCLYMLNAVALSIHDWTLHTLELRVVTHSICLYMLTAAWLYIHICYTTLICTGGLCSHLSKPLALKNLKFSKKTPFIIFIFLFY
jgi:hypothetical protein